MRMTPMNNLPPRKEYIQKVIRALTRSERTEKDIMQATGLTKTQTLCSLEALIKQQIVVKDLTSKCFRLYSAAVKNTGKDCDAEI